MSYQRKVFFTVEMEIFNEKTIINLLKNIVRLWTCFDVAIKIAVTFMLSWFFFTSCKFSDIIAYYVYIFNTRTQTTGDTHLLPQNEYERYALHILAYFNARQSKPLLVIRGQSGNEIVKVGGRNTCSPWIYFRFSHFSYIWICLFIFQTHEWNLELAHMNNLM